MAFFLSFAWLSAFPLILHIPSLSFLPLSSPFFLSIFLSFFLSYAWPSSLLLILLLICSFFLFLSFFLSFFLWYFFLIHPLSFFVSFSLFPSYLIFPFDSSTLLSYFLSFFFGHFFQFFSFRFFRLSFSSLSFSLFPLLSFFQFLKIVTSQLRECLFSTYKMVWCSNIFGHTKRGPCIHIDWSVKINSLVLTGFSQSRIRKELWAKKYRLTTLRKCFFRHNQLKVN